MRICPMCNKPFEPSRSHKSYCSGECIKEANRRYAAKYREKKKASKPATKAKKTKPKNDFNGYTRKPIPKGQAAWYRKFNITQEANKYEQMISRTTNYASKKKEVSREYREQQFHEIIEQVNCNQRGI